MKPSFKKYLILLHLCVCMVIVYAANSFLNLSLLNFGISPRRPETLLHIYSSPFLHGSLSHLLNNLSGLLLFGWLCLLRGTRVFVIASFIIISSGGFLLWVFGRPAMHIGASGWVFGLWSLSIAIAWFERKPVNILLALVIVLLYGGMIYGMLPGERGVSWEAHLFGVISGIMAAWYLASANSGKISTRN